MPCHVGGQCLDLVGPLWVPLPVHCASAHFAGGTNPMFGWTSYIVTESLGNKIDLIHVVGSTQIIFIPI